VSFIYPPSVREDLYDLTEICHKGNALCFAALLEGRIVNILFACPDRNPWRLLLTLKNYLSSFCVSCLFFFLRGVAVIFLPTLWLSEFSAYERCQIVSPGDKNTLLNHRKRKVWAMWDFYYSLGCHGIGELWTKNPLSFFQVSNNLKLFQQRTAV